MKPANDRPDTRNARGRATTRSIERESVRLALETGPAALTVDQICAAAGISPRTFFNHFPTKEDALLGWELPQLDEARVRTYLADPDVGILDGAISLVKLPEEMSDEPELSRARFRLLAASPLLAERQAARLHPLALEVAEIVYLKLKSLASQEIDEPEIRRAADLITQMAASLTIQRIMEPNGGLPPHSPRGADRVLEPLRWIWPRLIG